MLFLSSGRLMQNPMGPRRCLAGRDARREPQTNSRTIRKARNKADRPAQQRPEGFARKVPSCGVALLVEQNERSTFVARLASEHFSCKRGSQRVLHQPAGPYNMSPEDGMTIRVTTWSSAGERRRHSGFALAIMMAIAVTASGHAPAQESYPNRPIR